MNVLRRWSLRLCLALFLMVLSHLFLPIDPVFALSVHTLGDYDNIAVLEVSGDYSATDASGAVNVLPRQEVSREFYRTHEDIYDFLVLFTNFDFALPGGAKAYFLPVKNDVEGIGLELYDAGNLYSADGSFLSRLEGLVEMANIDSHVLEPSDPDFEKTLQTLTHEIMHRWGAYLTFLDEGEQSDALLGLGRAHWSFLLDSQGSSLYGNHWQDNGDGTFTSIEPQQALSGSTIGRVFSLLELYLMGLTKAEDVPALTLIDSPGIDVSRPPEIGVTIPGSVKNVTMEKVVAAVGERFPAVQTGRQFRVAFLYLVQPGSWSAADAASLRQLHQIKKLQTEWGKRFSILTDGAAIMTAGLNREELPAINPEVVVEASDQHVAPSVAAGVNWLLQEQAGGGFWQDYAGSSQRDTAAALAALQEFPIAAIAVANGQSWLRQSLSSNSDYLARKLLVSATAGTLELEQLQNLDGGWGSAAGYNSNPLDSSRALQTLTTQHSTNGTVIDAAIAYLRSTQGADGGWSATGSVSMVQPTAMALLALHEYGDHPVYDLQTILAAGTAWLLNRQNNDGGFGNGSSTVYDSACALLVLKALGSDPLVIASTVNYLLTGQGSTGGWNHSSFQTAMAVQALYVATMQTDLQVTAADLAVEPFPVVSMPTGITVSAQVWNLGDSDLSAVTANLYLGDIAAGELVGNLQLPVAGHSFTNFEFPLQITTSGDLAYWIVIDPQNLITESSENNNSALLTFAAGETPLVGFSQANISAIEAEATMRIDVTLSHSWDQTVAVAINIAPGGTAVAGADFILSAGTLLFNPGETLKSVDVAIVNDLLVESDEEFTLLLSAPVNADLGESQITLVIVNDDQPPVVGFAASNASGVEADSAVVIPVVLSFASPVDISVDYLLGAAGSGAVAGEDFLSAAGTVVIPAGETSTMLEATVVNDTLAEADEQLVVKLQNPSQATLGMDQYVYTILDDDALPQVVVSSPVEGQTYTSGALLLQYQTNMADDQVEVYLDGLAIETRTGQPLVLPGNGSYTLRVLVSNVNHIVAEQLVSFVYDDSRTPPVLAWERAGNLIRNSYYSTFDQLGYAEAAGLFVYGQNYDLAFDPVEKSFFARLSQDNALLTSYGFPATWNLHTHLYDSVTSDSLYSLLEFFDATQQYSIRRFNNANGAALTSLVVPHAAGLYEWHSIAIDASGAYWVAGSTREGVAKNTPDDNGNIQLVKVDAGGTQLWTGRYATVATDTVVKLLVDQQDNLYLLGTTKGYLGEGGGINTGGNDLFLLKIDKGGNLLWSRQWGSAADDEGRDLALDSQGNLLLLGATGGTFDGVLPTYEQDALLVKLDADGKQLWFKQEHAISSPRAVAVAPENEIVIAGGYGSYLSGVEDYCQIRWSAYTANGEKLWSDTLATGRNKYDSNVGDLLIDPHGNLFVTINWDPGYWSSSSTILRKYTSNFDLPAPVLTIDPYLYHPATGEVSLSGTAVGAVGLTLEVDSLASTGPVDLSSASRWSASLPTVEPGQHQVTVRAVNSHGRTSVQSLVMDIAESTPYITGSVVQYGTGLNEVAVASGLDRRDQLYIVGQEQLSGATDQSVAVWQVGADRSFSLFDNLALAAQTGGTNLFVDAQDNLYLVWNSGGNAFVRKYGPDRTPRWTSEYSSRKGEQSVQAVAVDAAGNCYLAGYTTDSPDRTVVHGGGKDYFLAKFNGDGVYQWSRLAGPGHPGDQVAYGVNLDAAGNVYLVGHTEEMMHDIAALDKPFVVRYDGQGTLLQTSVLGEAVSGVARDLALDRFDNLYVVGDKATADGLRREGFIAKFAADGTQQWFEVLFDWTGSSFFTALGLDSNDKVLAAGYRTVEGSAGAVESAGDGLWIKYDADGGVEWREDFGSTAAGYPVGIHETSAGTVLVVGSYGNPSTQEMDLFVSEFLPPSLPQLHVDQVVSPISSDNYLLTGQVSAGASVAVTVTAPLASAATVAPVILDSASGLWSCAVSGLVAEADNALTVFATAAAGTTSRSVSIYVDTLPPALWLAPVSSPTAQANLTLTGTTEPGAMLSVIANGDDTQSQSVPVTADGRWRHDTVLSVGDNQFLFTAEDAVGHQTLGAVTVNLTSPALMKVTLSPNVIGSAEATLVLMTIENIAGGGEVVVEEFLDINDNHQIELDEPLIRRFAVADQRSSEDLSIQGDEDLVRAGVVVTTLNYHFTHDLYHATGRHLFRVSKGTSGEVVSLDVLEAGHPQMVSGFVLDEQGRVVSGAILRCLDPWARTVAYAFSDENGSYILGLKEPGEYRLVAFADGYNYDKMLNPFIVVGSGEALSHNPVLSVAANYQSGLIRQLDQAAPLAGALIHAENHQFVGAAWSDAAGRYQLSLPDGDYDLSLDLFATYGSSPQGLYGYDDPIVRATVSAGATIETIDLPAYQSTCRWTVTDEFNNAMAGIPLQGTVDDGTGQTMYALSNASGDYSIAAGLASDNWIGSVSLYDSAAQISGYVGTHFSFDPWDCSAQSLTVYPITAWIFGTVIDESRVPVAAATVRLTNVTTGVVVEGRTAADGRYRLGVHEGSWQVMVDAAALDAEAVTPVPADVSSGQALAVDFVVNTSPAIVNTISITNATYTSRKYTLVVDATSDYPNADLVLEYSGESLPMNFVKYFKGKYMWSCSEVSLLASPESVSVSGPEGRLASPVVVK